MNAKRKDTVSKLPTCSVAKRPKLASASDIKTDASKSANTKTAGLKRTASSVLTSSSSSNYGRGNLAAAKQCSVGTRSQSGASAVRPAAKPVSRPISSIRARSATPPIAAPGNTSKAQAKKPKRAAWDTKGQLEDLRQDLEVLKRQVEDKENDKNLITVQKDEELHEVESRCSTQMSALKLEHEQELTQLQQEIDNLSKAKAALELSLNEKKNELESLNDQNESLTKELRLSKKEVAMLNLGRKEDKFELESKTTTISNLTEKISSLEVSLSDSRNTVAELEQNKRLHESERRKLHNTIQELKGNIRVFCRVRPMLMSEADQPEIFTYPDLDEKKVALIRPNLNDTTVLNDTLKKSEKLDFAFDKVFQPDSSQSQVFEEISQLVQSALDGYNVCIFAYGQTGSGKTYTMQGPDRMDETNEGMIPRSIAQVFESASQLSSSGWEYKMEASFLEIYNETIRDLLGNPGKEEKYEIKTASGDVVVTNLTIVPVTRPRQVESLFETATKNRHVAETKCNARSSRSHSVFTLKISGNNTITSETCVGTLNLVDLAGSERLKESKSEGDRLRETQCINASLSALGNVIMSLAAKKSHIPYRDSKLTYLLQNSLGGNSKTLMFVNVSPQEEHFNETVNSLRFATKVNNCTIGTARKVVKS